MLIYKLRKMSTEELVDYAQAGISEALSLLVERYHNMVIKISNQFFGIWAEKSDIIQNGYVGLLKAVYYYKPEKEANFTTFAWTNINSEIKSFLTYLNRKKNKILSDSVSYDFTFSDDPDTEEGSYYVSEFNDSYEHAYEQYYLYNKSLTLLKEQISEEEYAIFELYSQNYSYSEISVMKNVKTKKVDNTIQKCRKKFREIFESESDYLEMIDKWFRGS